MRLSSCFTIVLFAATVVLTIVQTSDATVVPELSDVSISIKPPSILNLAGERITTSELGQQLIIESTSYNLLNQQQHFITIIEVRDYRDDTTQYLAWQSGDLEPFGNATIGSAWSPTRQSDYQARTFAISDFDNPQILSAGTDFEFFVR